MQIPILQIDLVYENEKYFVYKQARCERITLQNLSVKTVVDILNIFKKLLECNIILPDMYYRNFGYYRNKCYIFDYCDENSFGNVTNKFLICTMFHLFSVLFNCKPSVDIEEIKSLQFGKDNFPIMFANFLEDLYCARNPNIRDCLDYLEEKLSKSYNQYQDVKIDKTGTIVLGSHTNFKYNLSKTIVNFSTKSVLDAGGCIGGISCKLAQEYPDCHVTVNNITMNEISVAKEIKDSLKLQNVSLNTDNITTIKNKYDVTLYFALVHHLLKNMTFDEVMLQILRQTNSHTIIEFPLKGDVLLDEVIKQSKDSSTYNILESVETVKNELSKYFCVDDIVDMDYGEHNVGKLKRTAFICHKIDL